MPPRVSLALPVCNGEGFVAAAVQSILDQSFADFELIITDNASTDATELICREFATRDTRIRYARNERNLGAAANFNLGFRLASGEFFKWCAHDDFISVNYLASAVRVLASDPQAVIAYGELQGVDATGAATGYLEMPLPDIAHLSPARRFRVLLARHGVDAAIFGLIRSSALARSSLHQAYYGSDCALLAELALLGNFVPVRGITLYNREHPRRSVNIHSSERLLWQNPTATGGNAHELCSRIGHLVKITWRHRAVAPLHQSLFHLLVWTANPVLLARCALEMIGVLSPALRGRLRAAGLALMKWASRPYRDRETFGRAQMTLETAGGAFPSPADVGRSDDAGH